MCSGSRDGEQIAAHNISQNGVYVYWPCMLDATAICVLGTLSGSKSIEAWMLRLFLQLDLCAGVCSLGVVTFELWHPFSTSMERAVLLGSLQQHGAMPAEFEARHPAVRHRCGMSSFSSAFLSYPSRAHLHSYSKPVEALPLHITADQEAQSVVFTGLESTLSSHLQPYFSPSVTYHLTITANSRSFVSSFMHPDRSRPASLVVRSLSPGSFSVSSRVHAHRWPP